MKITFYYGTMNSGKTALLLGMYHNYCVAGKRPVLIKLSNATREKDIKSRMGITAKGFLLSTNLHETLNRFYQNFLYAFQFYS